MSTLGPALRVRDFRLWWQAVLGMGVALQMIEVAIGWEVYSLHRSALDLGWIGLAEFVPMFVLALPAGHLADYVPRRIIFAASLVVGVGIGVGLALVSASSDTSVLPYLALAVGSGTCMALGSPASRAMTPTLVPGELLASAMTLRSIATQAGSVLGPGARRRDLRRLTDGRLPARRRCLCDLHRLRHGDEPGAGRRDVHRNTRRTRQP